MHVSDGQVYKSPTPELRFVKRKWGAGFTNILQQKWLIVGLKQGQQFREEVWQDVPMEQEGE